MIPILYYHSVGPVNRNWAKKYLTLEFTYFEDQIKYISKYFTVIGLDEYLETKNRNGKQLQNALVITFDDGYLDNWIWAFPLLKKYGLKATIFVNPDFVDKRNELRPNLDDYWDGRCSYDDLNKWGFLSWKEMRIMEASGLVKIESHTMSHTKYTVSDKIKGFHCTNADSFYTICNLYPDRKPYYIGDQSFNTLIPKGFPLFEEASSVIARKKIINDDFINECIALLRDYDFENYTFDTAYNMIEPLYRSWQNNGDLIAGTETEREYYERLRHEIKESKKIIEKYLNKTVDFLCWPHGDNNQIAHEIALESGYKATMQGNLTPSGNDLRRIPARIGTSTVGKSRFLTMQRAAFKIKCAQGRFPYHYIHKAYSKIRY